MSEVAFFFAQEFLLLLEGVKCQLDPVLLCLFLVVPDEVVGHDCDVLLLVSAF